MEAEIIYNSIKFHLNFNLDLNTKKEESYFITLCSDVTLGNLSYITKHFNLEKLSDSICINALKLSRNKIYFIINDIRLNKLYSDDFDIEYVKDKEVFISIILRGRTNINAKYEYKYPYPKINTNNNINENREIENSKIKENIELAFSHKIIGTYNYEISKNFTTDNNSDIEYSDLRRNENVDKKENKEIKSDISIN